MLKPLLLITTIFFTAYSSAKLDTLPEEFADFGLDNDLTISYGDLDPKIQYPPEDVANNQYWH